MKNISFKLLLTVASFAAISYLPACKSKRTSDQNADSPAAQLPDTTVMTDQPAATRGPVNISPDDSLRNKLKDDTKDFPGVAPTVDNGEVTLTGTISRDKFPQLM